MRRIAWNRTALLLVLLCGMALGLAGCQFGKTQVVFTSSLAKDEVFKIDDEACTLAETRVFLTNYQNLYGTAYGVDLWAHDFGDNSLEQYVKDLTISQLAQIKSMDLLAKQREITLSQEELDAVNAAAEEYYASLSAAEQDYMGISEDEMKELYGQYALANKLYESLTSGINSEVSDDDARVMEAQQIYVTQKENADAVAAALRSGSDFLSLAGTYNEADRIEITFGRDEMPKEVDAVAFSLEPDAVSDMIETQDGYYFIKCINNYNQELTDANKEVILQRRKKEAFDDVYHDFVDSVPSEFNEELWEGVTLEENSESTTKSFFEVYKKYCK